MCMFMMKQNVKKIKRTPEQKAKSMQKLTKVFLGSESGKSFVRFMQHAQR